MKLEANKEFMENLSLHSEQILPVSWPVVRYLTTLPPGGGGYSHTLPIRVRAAQRGRDFKAPDLERGIHFRGGFYSGV